MNIVTDEKRIDEILERGVISEDGILPTKEGLKEKLMSGEKLRFYMGADPTAAALHLGHAQNLILLEDFRKLGHEVIFLIGDFTSMIGDPTDKGAARVKQTKEQVEENFKGWVEQVKNILSFEDKENPVQVKHNSEWLGKLNFGDVLELASNFTVQQMLERDMFEKRMKEEKPIYVHEFMYPLMQGYDSVAMDVDVELCGTDQIFNALAGRTLLQKLKGKNKFVVAANLIADEKTGELMSKSTGTGVFLDLSSNDLYGAVMSVTDGMIKPLFIGCTKLSLGEIKDLDIKKNPRDAKMKLAFEIVKLFRSEKDASEAQEYFVKTIQNKEIPDEVEEAKTKSGAAITDFMVEFGLATSKGDARRKIEQGGVSIDGEKITDVNFVLTKEHDGKVVKVGKHNFRKIVF
ncbi:MAG: tyrosine--tRNA ligase [Candidatus Moranbacteria bacterium]|nr:tyrosine--tRNA ligase [Candidatus Moranbacteria bacterium]